MVNPGSFTPLRKAFLANQMGLYAEAVANSDLADTIADIQRRYFKRFPITLDHNTEPTEEWLAQVDDSTPDEELKMPEEGSMDADAYTAALTQYENQAKLLKYRKEQIRRRLQYQYQKSIKPAQKTESCPTDPMMALMSNLTGVSSKKPRLKTAYNVWGPHNRALIDPIFEQRVRENSIHVKHQAALRSQIYKECFEKLDDQERQHWEDRAKGEHKAALHDYENNRKKEPSTKPEDHQRAIQGLPTFAQPILDLIAAHTGWKVMLLAGGPEPADQGRLNMISIHSGETRGNVRMNFGKSERRAYKEYILPIFGNFLKKCYTVEECRASSLPSDYGSLARAFSNDENSKFTLDSAEDVSSIKISTFAKSRTVSSETSASDTTKTTTANASGSNNESSTSSHTTLVPRLACRAPTLGLDLLADTIMANNPSVTAFKDHETIEDNLTAERGTGSNDVSQICYPCVSVSPLNSPPVSRAPSPALEPASIDSTPINFNAVSPHPETDIPQPSLSAKRSISDSRNGEIDGFDVGDSHISKRSRLSTAKSSPAHEDTESSSQLSPPSPALHSVSRDSGALPIPTPGTCYVSAPDGAPAWFSQALDLFQSIPMSSDWQHILYLWVRYQTLASNYQDRATLSSEKRPACIGIWIKNARNIRPKITNLRGFQREFRNWWNALQPKWRLEPHSGILRRDPDGDLDVFKRPGKNGLYSLIAALWFWGVAAKGKAGGGGEDGWKAALEDVTWVIDVLGTISAS